MGDSWVIPSVTSLTDRSVHVWKHKYSLTAVVFIHMRQ